MKRKNLVVIKRVMTFLLFLVLMVINFSKVNAQQFKIGKNIQSIKSSAVLELEDTNKALLLTRVANPLIAIVAPWRGMILFDSTRNQLAYYNGTTWLYPVTSVGSDSSIYSFDGTLKGNRVVTMGGNTLMFTGNTTTFQAGSDPLKLLGLQTISSTGANDSLLIINGGIVKKIAPTNLVDSNIYTRDGSLTGSRTVTMAANNLTFSSTNGNFIYNPTGTGKVGIGTTTPVSALQVKGTVRADSMVLLSNSLYKPLNVVYDSVAVLDSVGRLMKVGVKDILNANGLLNNVDWTANAAVWVPNKVIGGVTTAYGITSADYENQPNNYVRTTNYISAKDTLSIKVDLLPGSNAGWTGGYYMRVLEYSDVVGTLVSIDTIIAIVNTSNAIGAGLTSQYGWNNNMIYGIKLKNNTKYVKIDFLSSAYNNTATTATGSGRGFKNFSVTTVNINSLNYVLGGNSFGMQGILGLTDNNNLSLITNNVSRILIDTIGRVGIGTTTPVSALQVKGAVRADSVVLLSNSLYKPFNSMVDSVAVLDSVGRLMKVGVSDILNSATPLVTNLNWVKTGYYASTANVFEPNVTIGGQVATFGTSSNSAFMAAATTGAQMSNYMYVKDTIVIKLDIYATGNGTRGGGYYLILNEYSDVTGTLVKIDTVMNFLNVGATGTVTGINNGSWTNNLVYGVRLDSATRYIKASIMMNANNGNTSTSAKGFKNFSIITPMLSVSSVNYVLGGNSFGTQGTLGLTDKNNLSLITNNVNRMIIDTLGNVGIGTTTPIAKLQVIGDIQVPYGNLFAVGTNASNTDTIIRVTYTTGDETQFRTWKNPGNRNNFMTFFTNKTERMRIDTGGKVGIGTNIPYANLDVVGDIYMTNHQNNSLHNALERGTRRIGQKAGNTNDGFNGLEFSVDSVSPSLNEGNIKFITWRGGVSVNREVARINGTGNMGIGTSNPLRALQVNKGIGADSLSLAGQGGVFRMVKGITGNAALFMEFYKNGTSLSDYGARSAHFGFGSSGNNDFYLMNQLPGLLRIGTKNTEVITIDTLGKVGIGTNNPSNLLHVAGTTQANNLVLTNLELDTNNYNAGLTIDVNGVVRVKSQVSTYNTILQGIKATGGNAFGDTVRIGSYDAQPMRLYASNTPGVTISPTGTVSYVPMDSNTIYLRNIAYDGGSPVSAYTGDPGYPTLVTSGALSNLIDNNNGTGVVLRINIFPEKHGFDISLNGYYYIDSIVLVSDINGATGNECNFDNTYATLLNNTTIVSTKNINKTGYVANTLYGIPLGGGLANKLRIYHVSSGSLFKFHISEVYIYGRRAKAITTGDTRVNVNGSLALDNVGNGAAGDSLLTISGGIVKKVLPTTMSSQNIYNTSSSLTGNRVVTMGGNSLTFTGNTTTFQATSDPIKLLGLQAIPSTGVNDSLLTINGGVVKKIAPANLVDSNIYTRDGSLTSNRTVTMNANNLTFATTTGSFMISSPSGNAAPLYFGSNGNKKWHIEKTVDSNLAFVESGVAERMRIVRGGNVGIGTTNPISKLQVVGAVRADSVVLLSNSLYKPLNIIYDSVAILDSVGRLMKVGVKDILNSATPPVTDFDWVVGSTNRWTKGRVVGGQTSTYGINSGNYSNDANGYVQMTNYMYAKDTVVVKCDIFPGDNGGNVQGYFLILLEYSDAAGTLVSTDTLSKIRENVSGTNITGPEFTAGYNAWNNDLVYGKKLNDATRYIKVKFLSSGINVAFGRGFRNVSVNTPTVSANSLNYVQGGNSFGTQGMLGLTDKNNLSLITNNVNRILIDTVGNVGIGNTAPTSRLHITKPGDDSVSVIRIDYTNTTAENASSYGLLLGMNTGRATTKNGIAFYNTNNNRYMGTLWNQVGTSYNAPVIGFSLWNAGSTNVSKLDDVMTMNRIGMTLGSADYGDEYIAYNLMRGTRRWQMSMRKNDERNGLAFNYTPNGSSWVGLLFLDTSGRVGIGTNNPSNLLHVAGTAQANNLVLATLATGASSDNVLVIDGSNNVKKIATINNIYTADGSLGGNRTVTMATNNLTFNSTNGNFIYNPTGTGKMGIGTAAPYTNLDVVGDIYLTKHAATGAESLHDALERGTRRIGQKAGATDDGFNGLEFSVDSVAPTLNEGNIKFITWRGGVKQNREVARINGMGNMGIGTNNPISKLHVTGAVRADSLVLTGLATGASSDNVLVIDGSNNVKKIAAINNIYTADGSLGGNRTVTMATNNLIFNSTNGNFIYNPTGTGKMGIGTTSPTQKLTIGNPTGSVTASTTPDAITLGSTYSSTAGSNLKLRIVESNSEIWGLGVSAGQMDYVVPSGSGHAFYVNGSVVSPAMKITNSGNVGISNNNPISKLHVTGAVRADSLVLTGLATGASSDNVLVIDGSNNVKKIAAVTSTNIYTADGSLGGNRTVTMTTNNLTFNSTNGNFIYNPTGTGKVGIGTASPAQLLDVNGTTRSTTIMANTITMNATGNEGNITNVNNLFGYNDLSFSGNNSNVHMYISNVGNVGIGTASPAQLLDIQKSGVDNYVRIQAGATNANNSGILLTEYGNDYGWRIRHDAASDNLYIEAVSGSTVSQTPFFFQRSTGFVGIKNNSPSYELDVSGNMKVSGVISTTKVQGISDERLKKDISPIQDALSIVLKMRGVTYNWRKDMEKEVGYTFKEGKDYGVIAQEIQKVLPELVTKDAKGYLTVDYQHITPVLIEAIKEQQKEIETLNIKLDSGELKTKQLEDRLQVQEKEILELKKLVQQLILKK